jgi:hypothetical protein
VNSGTKQMQAIGGYFGLEGIPTEHYHKNALLFNTGRNAFLALLLQLNIRKVYFPFYTCDVLFPALIENNIDIEFYKINEQLLPDKLPESGEYEVVVVNNYFGLLDKTIQSYSGNIVVDAAQGFFSKPSDVVATFYSPRKFFGVSDGGILVTKVDFNSEFDEDLSYKRYQHLLKRIDLSAELGFIDFQKNEEDLGACSIKKMSKLTEYQLMCIDYSKVSRIRRENFKYLESHLSGPNQLNFILEEGSVPLGYPLFISNGNEIKKRLIEKKVYVPTLWPNVKSKVSPGSLESRLVDDLLLLPVDQRYCKMEMDRIIDIIENG